MSEYIVSARKYRPDSFESLIGQDNIAQTLKNSIIRGKLAHAYLFCGPRGVGKTTTARIFAKAINCSNPSPDMEPCGECESCRSFQEGRSYCIHELDAASNNGVDDIKNLMDQVQIPPQVGKYSVYIIDEVHMLSTAAFNAFLKTLEEPPSYVIFILATTEKHRILPTILSRCQVYDFMRMSVQDTIEHLQRVAEKEGYETEPDALNLIAQKADGGMRDALSIFDQMVSFTGGKLTYQNVCQSLNVLSTEYYFKLVDYFLAGEVQPCMLLLNEILQKGFDGGNFIAGLSTHLRNLLVARDQSTLSLLEMSEQMQRYSEQAARCKPRFIYRALKLCNDCDLAYKTSNNKRLQLEICLIQVAQLNEEDVPGAGRRPAKSLKPIFDALKAQGQSASTQASNRPVAQAPVVQPYIQAPHVPLPMAAAPESAPASAPQASGKLRRVSFRNIGQKKTDDVSADETNGSAPLPTNPLDLAEMRISWQKYVAMLGNDKIAMKQRMQAMQPILIDPDTIGVTVQSVQVRDQLEAMRSSIEQFIRQDQKNYNARIQLQLVEMEEKTVFNKTDHMQSVMKRNKEVQHLISNLQLELR